MPIWKFTQSTGKAGEIEATAGLSVLFDGDTPQREITGPISLSTSFEAELQEGTVAGTAGLFASFSIEQEEYGIFAGIAVDALFDALHLVGELDAGAGLSGEFAAEAEYLETITATMGLQAVMEAVSLTDSITEEARIQGTFQGIAETSRDNQSTAGISSSFDCFNWTEFLRLYGDQAVKRYFFTLTGMEDGLENVVIPIATIQTRIRNQEPTFLSVSIPGLEHADEISARSSGQMVIDMAYFVSGVEMHREEIVRANLETIDIHEGGTNGSVVLSGHKTIDWGAPKTVSLSGVTYRRTINGTTRLRTAIPDLYLKPGDQASYDEDTITVEQISIFVGPSMSSMEIAGQ